MPDGSATPKPLTIQDLAEVGRLVAGEDWQPYIRGYLDIPKGTLQSWANGRRGKRRQPDLDQYRGRLVDLVAAHTERGRALLARLRR